MDLHIHVSDWTEDAGGIKERYILCILNETNETCRPMKYTNECVHFEKSMRFWILKEAAQNSAAEFALTSERCVSPNFWIPKIEPKTLHSRTHCIWLQNISVVALHRGRCVYRCYPNFIHPIPSVLLSQQRRSRCVPCCSIYNNSKLAVMCPWLARRKLVVRWYSNERNGASTTSSPFHMSTYHFTPHHTLTSWRQLTGCGVPFRNRSPTYKRERGETQPLQDIRLFA